MEEELAAYRQESRSSDRRQRFDKELTHMRANAAKNCIFLTEFTYKKLVNDVKMAKMTTKKKPRDYWLLKLYDVMIVENKSQLIYRVKMGIIAIQFYHQRL